MKQALIYVNLELATIYAFLLHIKKVTNLTEMSHFCVFCVFKLEI